MKYNMLVRALGEFEVYQFMDSIEEFTEFYKANQDNFNIFEIADLSEIEVTPINDAFTVYDLILEHTGDHFWLLKDEQTGMYEPVDTKEQVDRLIYHLNKATSNNQEQAQTSEEDDNKPQS